MAIPSQQIGWSQRAKLLWYISKQLEKLIQVTNNVVVSPTTSTYNTVNLAFAIPDDGSSVACANAATPSLLVPIYYTAGTNVTQNVTILYYDTALTSPVASGYYSDGTTYYAVNIYGLVQVIGSCV